MYQNLSEKTRTRIKSGAVATFGAGTTYLQIYYLGSAFTDSEDLHQMAVDQGVLTLGTVYLGAYLTLRLKKFGAIMAAGVATASSSAITYAAHSQLFGSEDPSFVTMNTAVVGVASYLTLWAGERFGVNDKIMKGAEKLFRKEKGLEEKIEATEEDPSVSVISSSHLQSHQIASSHDPSKPPTEPLHSYQ